MKHKFIYIVLAAVLIVCIISGCTAQEVSENGTTESAAVSDESAVTDESNAVQSETGSDVPDGDGDPQTPSGTSGSGQKEETTTAKHTDGKTSATEPKKDGTTATTNKQTTTKRQTTTKKQTTTQMPATTKKPTTTKKATTTATQGLTESDIQWIQSEAHKYMQNKGVSIDSSVGSFSGRISTKDKSRSEVLAEVKEWIDFEYTECMNSGWNSVSMYCKYEKRSNGSYLIYVMYG